MKKLLFLVLFAPALLNGAANNNTQQVIQNLKNTFNGISNIQNENQRRQEYQFFANQVQGFLNQQNQNLSRTQRKTIQGLIKSANIRMNPAPACMKILFGQDEPGVGVADVQMQDVNNNDSMGVVPMNDDE